MCGIAGHISFDGPAERALVERMCARMVHRGPDAQGTYTGEGACLGIRRLRVVDIATGDQPVYNEDSSIAVVLNGEIYNFAELRERLHRSGHAFSTSGDSEVIAHLYEEYGDELVHHLHGMFAFALWDARRRRLLLARDRVGKKPLYYSLRGQSISFASELGALMQDPSIQRSIDSTALDQYLAYGYIPHPRSIYSEVAKLPPASTLALDSEGASLNRYWHLDYTQKVAGSRAELAEGLRSEIRGAVQRRMVADVPLGAFLSGGIDSSIVVAEMAAASSHPVKTFSIGFREERFSELSRARLVAERFATDHAEQVVEPDAVELLPRLVRHYGEPFGDSSAIPSFYLSEMTSRHVTVALNGDGGDESFAGYRRHLANAYTSWVDRLPQPMRRALAAAGERMPGAGNAGSLPEYASRLLASLDSPAPERYRSHVGLFDPLQRSALLATGPLHANSDGATGAGEDPLADAWHWVSAERTLDRLLALDVETYLPGDLLTKVDIASMAHSLEARSPLLDHRVMEQAAALPTAQKARGLQKKRLLRDAYRGSVPDEVLDGSKQGFAVPIGEWLRGSLRSHAEEALLDTSVGDLLDREATEELLAAHQAGRADHGQRLWALLFLAEWHEQQRTGAPTATS